MGVIKRSKKLACGSYGSKGTAATAGGYDNIMIPGARKKSDSAVVVGAECQAGGSKGLVTAAAGTATATVCCKYLQLCMLISVSTPSFFDFSKSCPLPCGPFNRWI